MNKSLNNPTQKEVSPNGEKMATDWHGCYAVRWSESDLNSESFSHP